MLMSVALGICCGVVGAVNWCDRQFECDGTQNSMCAFKKEPKDAKVCKGQTDITQPIQEYWLALFNTQRDRIAQGNVLSMPPAANMQQLIWSPTLAEQAKRWGFQCPQGQPSELDPCNKTPYPGIGTVIPAQVIQRSYVLIIDDPRAQAWEVFKSTLNNTSKIKRTLISSSKFDDYSSIHDLNAVSTLMANQRELGAVMVSLTTNSGERMTSSVTYMAPDNFDGDNAKNIYKIGLACSQCAPGFQCNKQSTFKFLCAKQGDPSNSHYADLDGGPATEPFESTTTPDAAATRSSFLSTFVVGLYFFYT